MNERLAECVGVGIVVEITVSLPFFILTVGTTSPVTVKPGVKE